VTTGSKPNVAARRLAGAVAVALLALSVPVIAQERAPIAPSAGGATPASAGASAAVMEPGYVNSPEGVNVRNPYGQCWRAGHWTRAMASEPCDATARASAPAPVVAAAPQPEPAPAPEARPEPAPLVQAEPPRPVLQKVTLSTDVLFEFNKAELRESGKQKLDEIAEGLKDAKVDEILAIGHADRIASEDYNRKLSEQRAGAVKTYLAQKGFGEDKVRVEGRGEQQPVTGDDCAKMGPERASNKKLVNCLQPDRRVEIEVFGTREIAGSGQPAAGGTSETPSGSGSSGSSR